MSQEMLFSEIQRARNNLHFWTWANNAIDKVNTVFETQADDSHDQPWVVWTQHRSRDIFSVTRHWSWIRQDIKIQFWRWKNVEPNPAQRHRDCRICSHWKKCHIMMLWHSAVLQWLSGRRGLLRGAGWWPACPASWLFPLPACLLCLPVLPSSLSCMSISGFTTPPPSHRHQILPQLPPLTLKPQSGNPFLHLPITLFTILRILVIPVVMCRKFMVSFHLPTQVQKFCQIIAVQQQVFFRCL